jgi:hypothetical protein
MYWYWSDDIAKVLLDSEKIEEQLATIIGSRMVAFRSSRTAILEAAEALLDDEEIPLAA